MLGFKTGFSKGGDFVTLEAESGEEGAGAIEHGEAFIRRRKEG